MGWVGNLMFGTWNEDSGGKTGKQSNKRSSGAFGWHTARIHSADCSHPEGRCDGSQCLNVGAWGFKD